MANKHGFAAVGLDNPKTSVNVGSAMRAVYVYDGAFLAITGRRLNTCPTDIQKGYKHKPYFQVDDLQKIIPYDCVPVAIDIIDDAVSLCEYTHPERAFYIFGAEDCTLGKRILSWCRDVVYIPTVRCMNLAATVNIVLYDRMCKRNK